MAFRFKQFSIKDESSAMKIGTDGVLLGAWAQNAHVNKALDIGSGSGLVGLMLAQRYANAIIHMVEIDRDAYEESQDNINNAPFGSRCSVFHEDILRFNGSGYDLIVSNPPFHIENSHARSKQRSQARSAKLSFLKNTILKAQTMLAPNGLIVLIIPVNLYHELDYFCNTNGLWCSRKCQVFSKPDQNPIRVMASWQLEYSKTIQSSITIRDDQDFHASYKALTAEFYLNF